MTTATRKPRTGDNLRYSSLVSWLEKNDWRKQSDDWKHGAGPESIIHHIEFWNSGADLIVVYRLDASATVFVPVTSHRASSYTRKVERKA